MNASRVLALGGALFIAVLMLSLFPAQQADAQGCSISNFSLSPNRNTYNYGDWVTLSVQSNCGTVRFRIENLSTGQSWNKAEIGSSNQTETWKTDETGSGQIRVSAEARGSGGWENADRRSMTVSVSAPTNGGSNTQPTRSQAGMDLSWFCTIHLDYDRIVLMNSNNAYTWVCVDGNQELRLDEYQMGEACRALYGNELPYPGLDNPNDPYDWACYSSPHNVQQMPTAVPPTQIPPQNSSSSGGSSSNSSSSTSSSTNAGSGSSNSSNTSSTCSGSVYVDLSSGDTARVKPQPPYPNNVRSGAGRTYSEVFEIPAGDRFSVLSSPVCNDDLYWVQVSYGGRTGWTATGSSDGEVWVERMNSGSSGSNSNGIDIEDNIILSASHTDMTHVIEVNPRTCAIVNGSSIVAAEINWFRDWNPTTSQAINYFWPSGIAMEPGRIEQLRLDVESVVLNNTNCRQVYYTVGGLYMDTSGLGNILFGYYIANSNYEIFENSISNLDQYVKDRFRLLWDYPDDISQRYTGNYIANNYSDDEVTAEEVEIAAEVSDLQ